MWNDVNRPCPTEPNRRRRGKSDPRDAQNTARAVLRGGRVPGPSPCDAPLQFARMYKLAKGWAVKAGTQAINQLKAVLVSADANRGKDWPG
ncbi:hypothetical protein [Streptomyces sp. NPDC054834]